MKLMIECVVLLVCLAGIGGHPVTETSSDAKDSFIQIVTKPSIKINTNPVIGENVFKAAKPGSILRIPENVFSSLQGEFSSDYPNADRADDDSIGQGDDDYGGDTHVKTSVNKGPRGGEISVEELTEKVIENNGGVNTAENTDIKPSNTGPTSKPQRAEITSVDPTSKPQSPTIEHSKPQSPTIEHSKPQSPTIEHSKPQSSLINRNALRSPSSLITQLPSISKATARPRITPVTILLPSSSPNLDQTTNNPLDNLKDFTTWRANGASSFGAGFENEIEGNEFEFLDQLAVESENSAVTAHIVVPAPKNAILDNSEAITDHDDGLTVNSHAGTAHTIMEEAPNNAEPPYAISTVKTGAESNNSRAPSDNSSAERGNNRDYVTEVIEPEAKTEKKLQVVPSIESQAPSRQEIIATDVTPSPDIKIATLSRLPENVSSPALPNQENESEQALATTTPATYPQLTTRIDPIFDSHKTDPPFIIHRRFTTERATSAEKVSRKSPDSAKETTEPQIDKVRADTLHNAGEVVQPPIRKTTLRDEPNIKDSITPSTHQIKTEEDKHVPPPTTRSSFLFIKKSPITIATTTTSTTTSTTTTTTASTTITTSTTSTTTTTTTTTQASTTTAETEHVTTSNQAILQQKDDNRRPEILTPQDDHLKNDHKTNVHTLEENLEQVEETSTSTHNNTEEITKTHTDHPSNILDETAAEHLPHPLPCLDANTLEEQFEDLPLVSISKNLPHAMMLLVKPSRVVPNTEVRIMYERVRHSRTPNVKYLSDPIVEYIAMVSNVVEHGLYDLPVGKYIVCGEAVSEGEVFQTNCFETVVQRPTDKNMLQTGVIALIIVAIIIAGAVVVYAAYYRAVLGKNKKKERELQEKVERFAKKERDLQEKELAATSHNRTVFPDPNEPYEERCIM